MHKQFPDIVEQAMEAIKAAARRNCMNRGEITIFDEEDITDGLRATFGNSDAILFAAEDAFRAGMRASGNYDPDLAAKAWSDYDPAEAVKQAVQEMAQ